MTWRMTLRQLSRNQGSWLGRIESSSPTIFPWTDFGVWNIRGLNSPIKQKEVKHLIVNNNLVLVAILETKFRDENIDKVTKFIFGEWVFTNNNDLNPKGRIWVAWNQSRVNVRVTRKLEQVVHWEVTLNNSSTKSFVSFVYGSNNPSERRMLWENLGRQSVMANDVPWVVLEDFNATRSMN